MKKILLSAFALCCMLHASWATIYVDHTATGNNDGSSWADAFTDLQDALAVAINEEVWVSAGVYTPDASDRTISFRIPTGVQLYGGFNSSGTSTGDADPVANVTVLSGDLNGDDNGNISTAEFTRSDNSYHIIRIVNSSSAVVNGFTISGANANGTSAHTGTLESESYSNKRGGAIYIDANGAISTSSFFNCIIENNSAVEAAALCFWGRFGAQNYASYAYMGRNIIRNNASDTYGAIISTSNSTYGITTQGEFYDNIVYNNTSNANGGVFYMAGESEMEVYGNTFYNNSCTDINSGDVIHVEGSVDHISNNIFAGISGDRAIFTNDGNPNIISNYIETGEYFGITGNVGFTDAANGDFTLTNSSVVVDRADIFDGKMPGLDFNGNGRQGNAPDLGALESAFTGQTVTYDEDVYIALGEAPQAYNFTTDGSGTATLAHISGSSATATGTTISANSLGNTYFHLSIAGDGSFTPFSATVRVVVSQQRWYVDKDATGNNDGTTWEHAFTNLHDALAQTAGSVSQLNVWVADGTYLASTTGFRGDNFRPQNNFKIYGGFNGTESSLEQRNPSFNQTILSGDLNGDDNAILTYNETTRQDNSFHVIRFYADVSNVLIDGFTITGGNANGNEAHTSLTVSYSDKQGGAVYADTYGGVINNNNIVNCVFEKNTGETNAVYSNFLRWGQQNRISTVNFDRCIVRNNHSENGAAIRFLASDGTYDFFTSSSITNSLFENNSSVNGASCIDIYGGSNNTGDYVNNTFTNNAGVSTGTTIYMHDADGTSFTNNIVYGNGANPIEVNLSSATIDQCFIDGGFSGGTNVYDQDPLFVDAANGDYTLQSSSTAIDFGNTTYISGFSTDLFGIDRVLGTNVDLGAYEYTADKHTTINETICNGDFYSFDGNNLTTAGLYYDTIPVTGGDSIITLNLSVNFPVINIVASATSTCGSEELTLTASGSQTYSWDNGVTNGVAFTPTSTQTYSVTATNAFGCTATDNISISYNTGAADVSVTASSNTICQGGSVTVSTSSSDNTYHYYLYDSATDEILDGPVMGTGSALQLESGAINANADLGVFAADLAIDSTALTFDGTDDYVVADVPANLDYTDSYTVEAWVNTSLPFNVRYQNIFFAGDAVGSDIEMYIQKSTNDMVIFHNRGNGGGDVGATYSSPPSNQWYHMAVTFDGTAVELFYDGVSQGATTMTAPVQTTNSEINLGYVSSAAFLPSWGNKYFYGSMDEVRVWDDVRTSQEIVDNMHNCLTGAEDDLVTYFNFEDGTGSTSLTDFSANANHGTLTNMDENTAWVDGAFTCGAYSCRTNMSQMASITVTNPSITASADTVCYNEPVTLTASGATTYAWNNGVTNGTPFNATISGYYHVTATTGSCTSVDSVEVTVGDSLNLAINASAEFFCSGTDVTLTATGALNYTWDNGVTNGVEFVPTATGVYNVTGTDAIGCSQEESITLTLTSGAADVSVTASANGICGNDSVVISTSGSDVGFDYELFDVSTGAIVGQSQTGTGNTLAFSSGLITSDKEFGVRASSGGTPSTALAFDGVNDKVNTGFTTSGGTEFTVEGWIYPQKITYSRLFSSFDGTGSTESGQIIVDTYDATVNNGRALRFATAEGTTQHVFSVPNVLTLHAWNHVAATFNNGVMVLYVDGVIVGQSSAPFTQVPANNLELHLGEEGNTGASEHFYGMMDEVRVWNFARSSSDFTADMNIELTGNENGLELYLPFDEGSGSTTTDVVNGTVGTLIDMDTTVAWVNTNTLSFGGCQSTMSQTVLVESNAGHHIVETFSVCSGDSFTFADGTIESNITSTTSHTSNLSTVNGCDSTFITTVEIITVNTIYGTDAICSGESYTFHNGTVISNIMADTTYNSVYTSVNGCDSLTHSQSIVVNQYPDTMVTNASGVLTAETANSYQWVDCGTNSQIAGATSQTYTPLVDGSYSVELSNGSCTAVSECHSFTVTSIGIMEANMNNQLNIYPNPTKDKITVEVNGTVENITVFNAIGNMVMQESGATISTKHLANGMYSITIKTNNGIAHSRFIKE